MVQDAAAIIDTAAARGALSKLAAAPGLHFCVQRPGETVYLPPMCTPRAHSW